MVVSLKLQFYPRFFLLCLMFFILFCLLGIWQIHRYYYKKSLLVSYQACATASPKVFSEVIKQKGNLQFLPVSVDGNYMTTLTVLMPTQYQGQEGFEILTPMKLSNDKKLLLVDRGWIAKAQDQRLPKIAVVTGRQHITGYIKYNEYRFILGSNILSENIVPMVVQRIDIDEMCNVTHHDFYPFMLRLNPKEPNGFVRDWSIATIVPERHLAYALQWFGLAVVVVIGYIAFCRNKIT
jgi:surfeit locus 1 family protein